MADKGLMVDTTILLQDRQVPVLLIFTGCHPNLRHLNIWA